MALGSTIQAAPASFVRTVMFLPLVEDDLTQVPKVSHVCPAYCPCGKARELR